MMNQIGDNGIGGPILYRYSVKITIFDKNGNVVKRDEKLFRLRSGAEDFGRNLKKKHTSTGVISLIDVIKLEEGRTVNTFKSKRLQQEQRKRRK